MKRLPPYGKQVIQALQFQPSDEERRVLVFIGPDAWTRAQFDWGMPVIALPTEHQPATFRWPVSACDVTIMDSEPSDPALQLEVARECLRAEAKSVFSFHDGKSTGFFAEVSHAA